jgi:hypothetical protein
MAKYALQDQNRKGSLLSFRDIEPANVDITNNCDSIGLLNISKDSYEADAIVRVPVIMKIKNEVYPSIAIAAIASYFDCPLNKVKIDNETIYMGSVKCIIDSNGEIELDGDSGDNPYPSYTFSEVLNGKINKNDIENKMVFIVYKKMFGSQTYRTKKSSEVDDYEILINALRTLFAKVEVNK